MGELDGDHRGLPRHHGLLTPDHELPRVRKTVAEIVAPPDELMLFCGMSIGYEDFTVDYIRTGRAALAETVTFLDG